MTTETAGIEAPVADYFRFERKSAGDFPYYMGIPAFLTGWKWLVVMVGVLAGFSMMNLPWQWFHKAAGGFLQVVLFAVIPLIVLALVSGGHWTGIFRKLKPKDVVWMFAVAGLNIAVSLVVAVLVNSMSKTNANPIGGILGAAEGAGLAMVYLRTAPSLFAEEVISILPFLAILWLGTNKLGMARKHAVLLAWIGAALAFGAFHLPTYGWNFVQCFVIIGSARIVLLLGYVVTKNILVSAGAHIINDWLLFTVIVVLLGQSATA